jgi:hypothetical protein
MNYLRFIILLLAGILFLVGCNSHSWKPSEGKNPALFDADKAVCSYIARHGGSGFAASGTQNFVAGAHLGHAIGESARTQADFNDCMIIKGWKIADAEKKIVESSMDNFKSQIAEFCKKQEYNIIFNKASCNPQEISLASLSDKTKISSSEKPIFAAMHAEFNKIMIRLIDALKSTNEKSYLAATLILEKSNNEAEKNSMSLYEGIITWDIYNKNRKDIFQKMFENLRGSK